MRQMDALRATGLTAMTLIWVAASAAAQAPTEETTGTDAESLLQASGLELPEIPPSIANYVRTVRTGRYVFTAGHGPLRPDGTYVTGKLGRDLDVEQGYAAARLTAIALLSSLRAELGDLNRVERIVKVTGMVNATPDFVDHSQVINGCSDLLVEIFGDRGRHARAAVGMASLPRGFAVEIEMIVEVGESYD